MNDATIADQIEAEAATSVVLTPGKGLLVLAGIVVVVGTFIAINYALGIADFWAAFLFLLYWSTIEKMAFAKLPHCIVGALLGLLMGYLLQTLPLVLGPLGGLVFLGAILLLTYAQIMGWLPMAINTMTMLFLTVATIPALQAHVNFANLLIALALGVGYFVGLIVIGNFIKQRMVKS